VKLTIAQDHKYAGKDFWHWRAWIEGEPADLGRVENVKWFLHPSFSPSVVVSSDRSTGFRLESGGWGTFTLRAEVHCVDGSEQTLHQLLELYYPDEAKAARERGFPPSGPGTSAADADQLAGKAVERGVRKVFLSYESIDRSNAVAIRRALETQGMTVVDDSAISEDQPVEHAVLDLLINADATVAYLDCDQPSPFVAREINASISSGKPTLVVTYKDLGPIAGVPSDVPVLKLDPTAASGIAGAITKKLAGASKAQ